jgi:hypothetical protein
MCEHCRMRRALLTAGLALLAVGCGGAEGTVVLSDEGPAPPQEATLDWREAYGEPGARLVFRVESLEVEAGGWRARVSVRNDSRAQFAVASGPSSLDRAFGLMLLPTGDIRELDRLNRAGELPPVRQADRFDPPLPGVLEPGRSWRGTMAARGSLPAGSWARVVFGAFVTIDEPPEGLQERVVWITDHAHRLRPGAQPTSARKSGSSASEARSVSPAAISR